MRGVRSSVLLMGLGLTAALVGCASVDPAPFQQFAQGLGSLRDGADAQAAVDVQKAREDFFAKVRSNEIPLSKLRLNFEGEPFQAPYAIRYEFLDPDEAPLYVKFASFQRGLGALNSAMVSYAGLLVRLAGDEVVGQSTFDQLATDLNANASSAASTLGLEIGGGDRALLTTAAVAAFQAVVEKKRRRQLGAAIEAVQPQVVEYARAAAIAIDHLATGVTLDYVERFNELLRPVAEAVGRARNEALEAARAAGRTEERARKEADEAARNAPVDEAVLEQFLALNEQTEKTLATLAGLHASYKRLPAAHAALVEAAAKKPGGLAGLIDFTNEALRLRTLYTDLAAANEAADG